MYTPIKFPGWRYSKSGEAQIFEREEDVPKGWKESPNDFKTSNEAVVDEASISIEESVSPATAPVEVKISKAKKTSSKRK